MSSKSTIISVAVLILILGGGYYAYTTGLLTRFTSMEEGNKVAPETSGTINAVFMVDGKSVMFVNGIATPPPGAVEPVGIHYFGNDVTGDLNHDGTADTAYLITEDGGGSGTFYYLVAALKVQNGYKGSNAVLLGDRIAPQATTLDMSNPSDPHIIVNYADRKKGEPMSTMPSVGVSRTFHVVNGTLVEVK